MRAKLLKKNDIRNSYRYFPKKNCTPEGVQRKKEIVFFHVLHSVNLLLVSPFFLLFHYLTVEDSHSGTIDVVVKTTFGGIAPTIYIE